MLVVLRSERVRNNRKQIRMDWFFSLKRHWLVFDMLLCEFFPKPDLIFYSHPYFEQFNTHSFHWQKSQDSKIYYKTSFAWNSYMAGIKL